MESVIAAFMTIAVLLFSVLVLTYDFLDAGDSMQQSWREMEERISDRSRTALTTADVRTAGGSTVEVTLYNGGSTRLMDFEEWDVFVQYYDEEDGYHVARLPFSATGVPMDNEWAVAGIYQNVSQATPETFEPGILNPGEEITMRLSLSPEAGEGTTNLVTFSTPNGVQTPAFFIIPEPEDD
jgi:archaellum component FlaF (FlaF/FlaG flagellin family)